MAAALAQRDTPTLRCLLADDVELRSNAIAGDLVVGRSAALAAIKAHRGLLFEPTLLTFDHLDNGWMIVPAQLRHSLPSGGMADYGSVVATWPRPQSGDRGFIGLKTGIRWNQ